MAKFFTSFFTLLLWSMCVNGQVKIGHELKKALEEQTISSEKPVPLIVQGDAVAVAATVKQLGGTFKYNIGDYVAINLPLTAVQKFAQNEDVQRIDGLLKGQMLNDSVRFYNNVTPLHEGTNGLDQIYRGKGVVIGIMDSGVDYRHTDFLDDEGNNRILSIWDQRLEGEGPEGFNYGLECDAASIAAGTCPSTDLVSASSHGTHVAGIALANDLRNDGLYTGMAPESNAIVVALDFSNFGSSVVDGAKYIYDRAQALGMPCVINLSAGSYGGAHDGRDVYTQALNQLIQEAPGRAFVNSAGNGRPFKLHLGYEVTQDTTFTWFRYRGNNTQDVAFSLYADTLDFENVHFNFQADRTDTFAKQGETPFRNILDYNLDGGTFTLSDTVLNHLGDTLGIVETTLEKKEGRYDLFVDINKTTPTYYWRFSSTGSGKIDVFSHPRLTGGSAIVDEIPSDQVVPEIDKYRFPDQTQNIVGFFNVSESVLSIANYTSKTSWVNVNEDLIVRDFPVGEIFEASSVGPSRDGRTKPDLASTGAVVVSTAKKEYIDQLLAVGAVNRVNVDTLHTRFWGTSMSAPAVSGGIALLFQRYPNMTNQEVIETVLNNTRTDEFTGAVPNIDWGYGKFDVFAAFTNPIIFGCTNPNAENYNPDATVNDGNCQILGCTDPSSDNYNPEANVDDGSCLVSGCTDPNAYNYNPLANTDDGTCFTPQAGEGFVLEFLPNPMVNSGVIRYAVPLDNTENLELQVYNEVGQLIIYRSVTAPFGELSFTKGESGLSSGLYYVRLRLNGGTLKTRKWVIQ